MILRILPLIGAALIAVYGCTAQSPARPSSQVALLDAFPQKPLLGPQTAKGAVIYNHGLDYDADSSGEPPFYLDMVRDAGWDVFTLIRPLAEDRAGHSEAILEEKAGVLRKEGYRRIVAAGQSFGAWIALELAAQPGLFDAVIGAAPARWGEQPPLRDRNAEIVGVTARIAPVPTMIMLFAGDTFDPGGRGPGFRRALAKSGAAYAVLDRPPGFVGHTSGMGMAFAAQYGHCIVAFLDNDPPPGPFACKPHQPTLAEVAARLPPPPPVPIPASSVASPYIGHWYGWYRDGGRENMLTIASVTPDGRAVGTYVYGPAEHDETGGSYAIDGTIDRDGLHVATPHSQLVYTLRADGSLAVHWTAAGGSGDAVLHRMDEAKQPVSGFGGSNRG
jgi:hypothetical protein